eukprot:TRINITY_DN7863_c6_g1_i1.p1 TRINITY_DN7863_c6_g1~~TRINITY_DN7863_c6_g1_i1.p1  ORF type:complete len:362 (-),score=99.63 TRINITY_DN7863_c6_g1_i1:8-1093(-)
MFYEKAVKKQYGEALAAEMNWRKEAVSSLEAEALDAAEAANEAVGRLHAEADDSFAATKRATELQVQWLEKERLQNREAHIKAMKDIEDEILGSRLDADRRIQEIEEEVEAVYNDTDALVAKMSSDRATRIREARDRANKANDKADERKRQALEAERKAKKDAKEATDEAERIRSIKVAEVERSTQVWIAAFEQALEETQIKLAEHLEKLLKEARDERNHLEDNRSRADAHWQHELRQLRTEASSTRLSAAGNLEEARASLRGSEQIVKAKFMKTLNECQAIEGRQVAALRAIADELDETRRGLGLKARDMPELVQSLKEFATRCRLGKPQIAAPKLTQLMSGAHAVQKESTHYYNSMTQC